MTEITENNITWQERMKCILLRVFIALAAVAACVGVYFAYMSLQDSEETQAWKSIYPNGSMEDFRLFMEKYPDGEHYNMARECFLEQKKVVTDWNEVKDLGNPYLLRDYINANTSSPYVAEAKHKLDSILWGKVMVDNDEFALREYISMLPEGDHIDQVKARLDKAEAATITSSQEESCLTTLREFYSALNSQDETRLMRCVNNTLTFQGKKANRSNVLMFMKQIYSEDVNSMRWSEIDGSVKKSVDANNVPTYNVSYNVDLHINREDEGKITYAYYECAAVLNEEFKITSLNMRRTASY